VPVLLLNGLTAAVKPFGLYGENTALWPGPY